MLGRFFAASRARLKEVAEPLGVRHLANMGGCTCDDADLNVGFWSVSYSTWCFCSNGEVRHRKFDALHNWASARRGSRTRE